MKTPSFWQHNGIISVLLTPISWVYAWVTAWRIKHFVPYKSSARVICIGNITAGGVGKTPVAIALAKKYLALGKKVVFLTRGYKGKLKNVVVDLDTMSAEQTGDEARLLAMVAPTVICPKRDVGAKMAEALGAQIIIMDDGLQNPRLFKDESWLIFDGGVGIGNGKIIPAGPLRETLASGQKRANRILIMGEDKTSLAKKCVLPVDYGRLVPQALDFDNKKVVAFCGIGHPFKFYQTLRELGCELLVCHDFEDHHMYKPAEIIELLNEAAALGAELVTTEKDYVKISGFNLGENVVHVVRVELHLKGENLSV